MAKNRNFWTCPGEGVFLSTIGQEIVSDRQNCSIGHKKPDLLQILLQASLKINEKLNKLGMLSHQSWSTDIEAGRQYSDS